MTVAESIGSTWRDFPETFTPDLNDKGDQKIQFKIPKNLDEYDISR